MAKAKPFSPLTLEIAALMNAGMSLKQIRAWLPDLTDAHIAAFMREMLENGGFVPQATAAAGARNRARAKPDREFIQAHTFKLRVALDGVKPPVWRRVVVPASITLDHLHEILQIVMGWTDSHLHSFSISGAEFTLDSQDPYAAEDERGVVLGMLVRERRSRFKYLYDFGDGWSHTITVESAGKIADPRAFRMTCLAGKRSWPPEDVGGPWGYFEFLEAINDPKHEEHESYVEWCGGSFDPEEFDIDAVNRELAKMERRSRRRNPRRRF